MPLFLSLGKERQEHLESLLSHSGSMLLIYLKTQSNAKVPSAFSWTIIATVNMISHSHPRISFWKWT